MKATIFQANQGDCLLLTGSDGVNILVDGGMKGSYRAHVSRTMGKLAKDKKKIDLLCVSHIDIDHINGIIQLIDDLGGWRVYKYQHDSGNTGFPEPKRPKPPEVSDIWHNSFKDQVDDNTGAIEDQLVANMKLLNMSTRILPNDIAKHTADFNELALGVKESLILSNKIGENQLKIPWNRQFGKKLIMIEDPAHPPPKIPVGGLDIFVLGPFKKDIEKLCDEWNDWLRENQEAVIKIRREAAEDAENLPMDEGQLVASYMLALAAELGNRNAVTTPNLASIMFLMEEDGKTVLMTGDGFGKDILKGLKAQDKLDSEGRLHVDVLKLQHHGSEHNIDKEFCEAITADHYVICANGSHENPDLDVLKLIIDSRIGKDAAGPHAHEVFKLWFSSSVKMAGTKNREKHMREVEKLVRKRAQSSGSPRKLRYRFLTRGSTLTFEI
jgi:beta-lactamase superfamily II metal-dependent hydrolase